MKIKAHGEVGEIRLTHKGCDMNFTVMLPVKYMDDNPTEPGTIAFIEFKDLLELEMMMHMLEKFRKACIDGMGKWREEHE